MRLSLTNRDFFREYLKQIVTDPDRVFEQFVHFHTLLMEANSRVNLISRQTEPEEIWNRHFYDSLIPLKSGFDFNDLTILDLGSGGGLPGIPLAITNPGGNFIILDSIAKKILEVKKIIKKLDLKNCYPICNRLEDFRWSEMESLISAADGVDVIVCRSVKIMPRLLKKMQALLKKGGYILLYKGRVVEESWLLKGDIKMFFDKQPWGERTLLKIDKL